MDIFKCWDKLTCQSKNAALICFISKALFSSNCSALVVVARESSSILTIAAFSLSERNVAIEGSSQTRKNEIVATRTVRIPSRMKLYCFSWRLSSKQEIRLTYIHLQPSIPPTPCILLIKNAKRPEKAPAIDAEAKMREILYCALDLGYLCHVSKHPDQHIGHRFIP